MFVLSAVGQKCEILACLTYLYYLLVASVSIVFQALLTYHQEPPALHEARGRVYKSINRVASCLRFLEQAV
jgi:hypothetical protein